MGVGVGWDIGLVLETGDFDDCDRERVPVLSQIELLVGHSGEVAERGDPLVVAGPVLRPVLSRSPEMAPLVTDRAVIAGDAPWNRT